MSKNVVKLSLMPLLAAFIFSGAIGCAQRAVIANESTVKEVVVQQDNRDIPGVVEYVWEEPMVDVVDVPPGLDPEEHYYRPAHQEVVEIRQGRWNYYRSNKGQ